MTRSPDDLRPEAHPEAGADTSFEAVRRARATPWPFGPQAEPARQLGDLLAERQVTRQDLAWVLEHIEGTGPGEATARIREAAHIILATMHRLPDVAMTLEDARLVAWPQRRHNRPLGELVEAGAIKTKELERAALYAPDARLREAARMMLPLAAQHEAQRQRPPERAREEPSAPESKIAESPPSPLTAPPPRPAVRERSRAHPMPIIVGGARHIPDLRRRHRWQLAGAALLVLALLALMSALLYAALSGRIARHIAPIWGWFVVLGLLLVLWWLSSFLAELWETEQSFYGKHLAEIKVARRLRHGLGGDWTLFRNVTLPERTHLDMVLLGPPGVFVLAIRAYAGDYRYQQRRMDRRTALGWRRMVYNPGRQVQASAGRLYRHLFEGVGHEVPVSPRLIWAGPGWLTLDDPEIDVWRLAELDEETEALRHMPQRLSAEERAALSGLLRDTCKV